MAHCYEGEELEYGSALQPSCVSSAIQDGPLFLGVLVMAFDCCAFLLHPHLFWSPGSSTQASLTWRLVVKRVKLNILYRPGSHRVSQLPYSTGRSESEDQPKIQGKRQRQHLSRSIMCAQGQGGLLASLFTNSLETSTQKKPVSSRVSPWLLRQTHNRQTLGLVLRT